ncbi:MAG: SUMF1/EgtB/PvdO family nonheme iron enzyme [Kiritimatiellae bacterium]|nr:SUMF1/EgtB/PvdO family nonheme iron enzyme [Kiritimatiellia bacterium]
MLERRRISGASGRVDGFYRTGRQQGLETVDFGNRRRASGDNRVLRGGSWNNNARNCRSANRNRNRPGNRNNNIGFRLACSAAPQENPRGPRRWPVPGIRDE